jgi:hypothetical protein
MPFKNQHASLYLIKNKNKIEKLKTKMIKNIKKKKKKQKKPKTKGINGFYE